MISPVPVSSATTQMVESGKIYERLAALDGVREVSPSRLPDRISVSVEPGQAAAVLAASLEALIAAETGDQVAVQVELPDGEERRAERRSRFLDLTVTHPYAGRIGATVRLEWEGEVFTGHVEGELTQAAELRLCASAALRAVEQTLGGAATLNVVGVKELPVFDHNLVVVLVLSPDLPDQHLIGTAIIGEDRRRTAALAALNATNRIVGRLAEAARV